MAQYREPTSRDWLRTTAALAQLFAGVIVVTVLLVLVLPEHGGYGWLILIIGTVGLFLLVRWHARNRSPLPLYGHELEITFRSI